MCILIFSITPPGLGFGPNIQSDSKTNCSPSVTIPWKEPHPRPFPLEPGSAACSGAGTGTGDPAVRISRLIAVRSRVGRQANRDGVEGAGDSSVMSSMMCRAASQHIFGERLFVTSIMLDAREIKE